MCLLKTSADTRPGSLPRWKKRGRACLTSVWKYELPCILSAALLFLVSWLFTAVGNLPNGLKVGMHSTPLFIKRNREQKGSLSWAPMMTQGRQEQATERQPYKAYVAPLLCLPIIHSGPGGVKVSAKTFTPPVHPNREMEWWKENTRGDGGGQVALLMTLECDGNAVNEEGWDKKLCFPRRDRQAREEPEEQLGSALLDAVTAEQSRAELCRARECRMNRVWLWGRQRWHREWAAPLFFSSPLPPSPRETVAALWWRSERWEMESEREWEKEREERDSSPRSPISSQ